MQLRRLIFGALFLLLCTDRYSWAQQEEKNQEEKGIVRRLNAAPLRQGMSMYEFVNLLGPPDDKQEYETHRREAWFYQKSVIRFQQGELLSWSITNQNDLLQVNEPTSVSRQTHEKDFKTKTGSSHSSETEALLGEILREIPSGAPDAPGALSPVTPIAPNASALEQRPGMRNLENLKASEVD